MTILFLGNSHVSAFKLATASHSESIFRESLVYCARGGDLAYASLMDGSIKASTTAATLSEQALNYFIPDNPELIVRYGSQNLPTHDLGEQFTTTGGQEAINLSRVKHLFYVAGVSPYDFVRLEKGVVMPYSKSSAQILCNQLLRDHFLLRDLFLAIRKEFPNCKQHFIGIPFKSQVSIELNDMHKEISAANREIIHQIIVNSDFDSIYMPSKTLLDSSLLFTKPEFTRGGRQESEIFQGERATNSDYLHMNAEYGKNVLEEYVIKQIA